jgi:hypothetical protein
MAKVLIERKNHEKAAIAAKSEDEKKSAIKASAELYKNQTKNAQNTLTQARKLAWQTFENDVEECRQINNVDTSSDISKSNQGEDALAPTLKKTDDSETKTITGTIKAQFESFKSLFNKD